ncbi:ABC transporter ATP-binding protein [Leptolinea tardivitalis]|uniref:ABC transporter n=1 Tax=Leptolinea tardivitalis TaxID=229920 RepID=A0A0P6XJC3_9CHLR|nr:ABC transporter ATP-binding protein [Leptolinea tardivitalis]KPL71334.1 ABC transporter [Leptolinea tardivitalis]GAP23112.1 ABC-type multidrug transport system, ATPase component [Leptolinea tardivitalis]
MISIKSLSKTYKSNGHVVNALNHLDLEIGGGMFGLLGPNGAGKTTLMRILAGIVNASNGSVKINGNDLATDNGKTAVKSILGYLPQELGMYPELSARQFVDYMAILKGLDDPSHRKLQVDKVLEMVGLLAEADRKIKGFSGGMKRRVGIAQALVNNPKLLIVDEPTAGLDPEERIRFRNLLVTLASDRTVLLSTHIVEDIGQTCRDLAVLSHGQVLFRGSPSELTQNANGHVWLYTTDSMEKPNHNLTVVSMLHLTEGIQYRLVGESAGDYPDAKQVQAGLEDGYVWLMKSAGQSVDAM